jgi:transposase InsO family protein
VGGTGRRRAALHRTPTPYADGSVESLNGRFRDELLNKHAPTIFHAHAAIERCRIDYDLRGPHTLVGGLSPAEFISDIKYPKLTVCRA